MSKVIESLQHAANTLNTLNVTGLQSMSIVLAVANDIRAAAQAYAEETKAEPKLEVVRDEHTEAE